MNYNIYCRTKVEIRQEKKNCKIKKVTVRIKKELKVFNF